MLWTIAVILLVLWLLGFSLHVAGGLIHILLVIAVIVGLVYVHLPFMVLPLYANLEKHDPALLDAAQDLGAGKWQIFWRVTPCGDADRRCTSRQV